MRLRTTLRQDPLRHVTAGATLRRRTTLRWYPPRHVSKLQVRHCDVAKSPRDVVLPQGRPIRPRLAPWRRRKAALRGRHAAWPAWAASLRHCDVARPCSGIPHDLAMSLTTSRSPPTTSQGRPIQSRLATLRCRKPAARCRHFAQRLSGALYQPSPDWHRDVAFHHRRTGAGTGSRETSAVVAHQLPQTILI